MLKLLKTTQWMLLMLAFLFALIAAGCSDKQMVFNAQAPKSMNPIEVLYAFPDDRKYEKIATLDAHADTSSSSEMEQLIADARNASADAIVIQSGEDGSKVVAIRWLN